MDEREFLNKLAKEYAKEGYTVISQPDKDHLPAALGDCGIDLVARRGSETVAIQVKKRDELYDLNGIRGLEERVQRQPGWRFELIVFPPEGGVEVPRDGTEVSVSYINSLTDEVKQALRGGLLRASFILAWSAAEATMREAARRAGVMIDREIPRFVLKTLYSNGVITRDDYERVEQCFHLRNAVVHGFAPAKLEEKDVKYLLDFSTRLLTQEPAQESA